MKTLIRFLHILTLADNPIQALKIARATSPPSNYLVHNPIHIPEHMKQICPELKKNGEPCTAWVTHGSHPPRCRAHGGRKTTTS